MVMTGKGLFVATHIISILIAMITSFAQTRHIVKNIRKVNVPALAILSGGLIAAVFGTAIILMRIKRGLAILEYLKNKI